MRIDLRGSGVDVKLVLPGAIETEIWDQPGNDPALYDGPFVAPADCAATIVEAIESDGFESFAPPDMPGGVGRYDDVVINKTKDVDAFIDLMGQMAQS
jgi:hypothetical protein